MHDVRGEVAARVAVVLLEGGSPSPTSAWAEGEHAPRITAKLLAGRSGVRSAGDRQGRPPPTPEGQTVVAIGWLGALRAAPGCGRGSRPQRTRQSRVSDAAAGLRPEMRRNGTRRARSQPVSRPEIRPLAGNDGGPGRQARATPAPKTPEPPRSRPVPDPFGTVVQTSSITHPPPVALAGSIINCRRHFRIADRFRWYGIPQASVTVGSAGQGGRL